MADVQLLRGISRIANDQNIKPDLDLEDLELKMVQQGFIAKSASINDKYEEQLKKISSNLGMDLTGIPNPNMNTQTNNFNTTGSTNSFFSNTKEMGTSPKPDTSFSYDYGTSHNDLRNADLRTTDLRTTDLRTADTPSYTYGSNYKENTYTDETYNQNDNDYIDTTRFREQRERPNFSYNISSEMDQRTSEQRRRQEIDGVKRDLGTENTNVWSIEQEKLEDQKTIMLEEIDSLMVSLEEDDVDISRIPKVTKDSPFSDVQTVHKILRIKNDRMRYCSFADEIVLLGAYGLEELFNGDNTWFGRQPDLRGWHSNVQTKLRRMRHDTSSFVSSAMGEHQIGPFARILLELVPSAFMYSKMRKEQYVSKKMYSETATARSIENIRNVKPF